VEHFKYLGTTLTKQNSIQEDIKSRLSQGILAGPDIKPRTVGESQAKANLI
jgi:hypothetical protein